MRTGDEKRGEVVRQGHWNMRERERDSWVEEVSMITKGNGRSQRRVVIE